MRENPTKKIENGRVRSGPLASSPADGANGAFQVVAEPTGARINIIASDGTEWGRSGMEGEPFEHVSVSTMTRCPTWAEMDWVKRLFWRDDETVMQLHVPRSRHVNAHEFCLHLWRPLRTSIPLPAIDAVGPPEMAGR